ncbi:HelD family protein [Luedemannella helvata]|uniref:AAA family ATPase n=1 Tax=Luedemannella helvata TaxID=349315 RepID=A0ABP4XAE9_9ACTN
MTGRAAELADEQGYFDRAEEHLRRRMAETAALADGAADRAAARSLRALSREQLARLGDSTAVAVGRIDAEDGERLYIGRHLIRDEERNILVVSWQADAAIPYHQASPADPHGLTRKRTYRCEGNTILDFSDVLFGELADAIDSHLLGELARRRDGTMRDIVATIQAAQFDLIRAPMDQLLVIEGGPGTGKTAIALHRVSWLLFHNPDRLNADDVLVVGPHPTFTRYIGQVLPALGDADVALRHVGQLGPEVPRGRDEPAEVAALKGDARMAGLLARALDARIGVPEPAERLMVGNRFITLPGPDVAAALTDSRAATLGYAQRRTLFRDKLTELVAQRLGTGPGRLPALDNLVDRLWPQLTVPAFLRDLLASRDRLLAAAADQFTAAEVTLLHRRGADRLSQEHWSAADLPLLDEADALINGVRRRYAHIVVDEVQDLSPMQLRSVARRSATGSLTIVGDLAQATGAWAAQTWEEITRHLPDTLPVAIRPLRYGYRVPRQAYAFAARLLPVAASTATAPEVVRDGPSEPVVHQVALTERAGQVAAVAMARAGEGAFVGVICPDRCRREVETALAANGVTWRSADRGELGGAVNLVSPREAKGLEFDAVVVVEPEAIVAEDERGHRMLYVALTRTTATLDVVCVGDPMPLTAQQPETVRPKETVDAGRHLVPLADYVANRIRATLPPSHWEEVLTLVRDRLTAADPSDPPGA